MNHTVIEIELIQEKAYKLLHDMEELNIIKVLGEKTTTKKSIADFFGVISTTSYENLKTQTEQTRKEWDRNI